MTLTAVPRSAVIDMVGPVLDDIGNTVRVAINNHLNAQPPAPWLDNLVADYPNRGGKAIRPALCIATCRAFGGTLPEAIPSAAAIELLHNAFLVHDDIEDGSELRRGLGTLHATEGLPLALNAGDAMMLEALSMLRANRQLLGPRTSDRVVQEFEVMLRHTVRGQAVELGWQRDQVVDLRPDDYLDLIIRKTCWYTTIHPLRVGALIGGRGRVPLEAFVQFGTYLGAAFQIQDDLLNLVGDESRYGKELLGDLFEGKRTLMLNHLLGEVDDRLRADIINGFLALPRSQRTSADAERILDLMHQHGSIDFARAFAGGIKVSAFASFEVAFADAQPGPDRAFVRNIIDFMLDRDL